MRLVEEAVKQPGTQDEKVEFLKSKLSEAKIVKFDPMSVLFSVFMAWAIQQLIAYLQDKIINKGIGDEIGETIDFI